ncbi:MAG: hypothetical protein V4644_02320 [Patescibacteria group bacterium]
MDQAPDPVAEPARPTPPPAGAPEAAKASPSYGGTLSIVLIVAILVAGAFYVWNERLDESAEMPEGGVRGEVLPEGTMPSAEGSAEAGIGESGPEPI